MTVTDAPKIITGRFDDPEGHTLERYLATGGYQGLRDALAKKPNDVIEEVKSASLLGRGGAGFPAGVKWGFCPPGVFPRYLVVNGDESEPGTYKDRLLMERDPHQLIEGVLIACYAVGCSQAFLYVRGEMALAQERIAQALNDAYAAGFVGKDLLGETILNPCKQLKIDTLFFNAMAAPESYTDVMTVTGTGSRSKSSNSRELTPTFGLSKSGLPVDQSGDSEKVPQPHFSQK